MGEKGTIGYNVMRRALLPPARSPEYAPSDPHPIPWELDPSGDRAFNPATGQNAFWDAEKQQWFDSKTGQPLSASALDTVS